ncbi:unnamed protein product [Eruca vesicaria subsp. sativa]|uniref:Uncharacterized protein n=1 Tax=Eruca vesicaria subsp. sativa TaxID=29727 RepID=A0ABC8K031_ERUVS|nr:unnamed protein product [Eruca vesicaria subsp. sativa]
MIVPLVIQIITISSQKEEPEPSSSHALKSKLEVSHSTCFRLCSWHLGDHGSISVPVHTTFPSYAACLFTLFKSHKEKRREGETFISNHSRPLVIKDKFHIFKSYEYFTVHELCTMFSNRLITIIFCNP